MAAPHDPSDVDPHRFAVHTASPRGFAQAYVREGVGGVPLVCVHGWPESKRIFWRVIAPLVAAGFEVIVADLRGFGDSEVAPDGFHDVPSHVHDVYALVHDVYTHGRLPLFAKRRVRGFERLAAAHREHHLHNGAPYGMLVPVMSSRGSRLSRSGSRPSQEPLDA